VLENIYYLLIK